MHKTWIPLCLFILVASACNLPVTNPPAAPTALPTSSPTLFVPAPTWTPLPTQTPPPSDIPFTIDCSALPAARLPDCEAFLAATRDQVYPVFREITGVSLSTCYEAMHYVILPTDPAAGAGGLSGGDTITYNQSYSIDLRHRYDVHEILHSISSCTRALDGHALHGLVMNAVYDRLGVHDLGYFDPRDSENLTVILDVELEKVKTAAGQELVENCRGILLRKMTIAYFDLGGEAVPILYRSTIDPAEIVTQPNETIVAVWEKRALQVQALLETLEQDFKYSIDVPECGY